MMTVVNEMIDMCSKQYSSYKKIKMT